MSSRRLAAASLALAVWTLACGGERRSRMRSLPAGDAVWFSEGLAAAEPEAQAVLSRGAFAHAFLPAIHLGKQGGAWKASVASPPPRPLAGIPVVLRVEADPEFASALSPGAEEALADSIWEGLGKLLAARSGFGKVEGVHLDLPFSASAAETFGALVANLRSRVPPDLFLTGSLRFAPNEGQIEDLSKRLAPLDGVVAFVFGEGAYADPLSADALRKPWWAGYLAGARGEWTDAAGTPRSALDEKFLRALSDDGRVPLRHDLALNQEGVAGFLFQPAAPVEIEGSTFGPGDQISFHQPLVTELLYRFGSDLAGRKLMKGRLVVMDGSSESERIFTLAALSDVFLGRPLLPDVRVSVTLEATSVRIDAENRSTHASVISRTTNWVEVDVASNHISDVQPGGFDRYEVFDAEGRPVTPGRATRVRFYETLLAPQERIAGAAILLRGRPPAGCCRFRSHVLAASGTELAGDWSAPPVVPTPTPGTAKTKPKAGRH
jgi:hypothetical protein